MQSSPKLSGEKINVFGRTLRLWLRRWWREWRKQSLWWRLLLYPRAMRYSWWRSTTSYTRSSRSQRRLRYWLFPCSAVVTLVFLVFKINLELFKHRHINTNPTFLLIYTAFQIFINTYYIASFFTAATSARCCTALYCTYTATAYICTLFYM